MPKKYRPLKVPYRGPLNDAPRNLSGPVRHTRFIPVGMPLDHLLPPTTGHTWGFRGAPPPPAWEQAHTAGQLKVPGVDCAPTAQLFNGERCTFEMGWTVDA